MKTSTLHIPYAWADFVPYVALYVSFAVMAAMLALHQHSTFIALLSVAAVLVLMGFGIHRAMLRTQEAYRRRIKANETTLWDVWVNGVKVGTVTDARYAAIQQHVYGDSRHAMAQFLNVGQMALVVIDKLVRTMTLLLIWFAVVLTVFVPAWYLLPAQEFQPAFATAIAQIAWLSVMTLGIRAVLGARFGFKNCYAAAMGRLLRQHCNTPAEGEVRLSRISAGALLYQTQTR
jgi:hypothetical protein